MPLLESRGSGSALAYGLGSASSAKLITESLVLYLDAAEPTSYPGSGNTWYDISGNGNNMALSNISYSSSNMGSIVFNGQLNNRSSGYISAIQAFNFNSADFSVSIWNYADSRMETQSTAYHGWIHFGPNYETGFYNGIWRSGIGDGNIYSSINNNGLWTTTANSGGGVNYLSTSNAPFNMFNQWTNFVFTFNGLNANIYINGINRGTRSFASRTPNSTSELRLGYSMYEEPAFWGNISQFLVYKGKCLTDAEVLQNFNAVKTRYGL